MFSIAILIGIYSYVIFSLGLLGLLYKGWIFTLTIFYFLAVMYIYRTKIMSLRFPDFKKISRLFLILLVVQGLINFIGALGPELGFDALWYHLTLPKIFLENHRVIHIPGGLFYYTDMPKLTEMLYLSALSLSNEISAKIIHFSFGLLVLVAIYKLSRKFLDKKFAAVSCLIFYSSLVVGWQSTTAYIDLARTFFEIMALWGFINYTETAEPSTKRGWFMESAVMLGLAIATKLLSLGTLFIFLFLIIYQNKELNRKLLQKLLLYICICLYVVLPWLLFSFFNTGNPIYPLFSNYVKPGIDPFVLNPIAVLKTFWTFFTRSSDPISPVYIIFLPLVFIFFKKLSIQMKSIAIYFFLTLIIWYFFPAKESRYMLPSLAAFSILISYLIMSLQKDKFIGKFSIAIVIFASLVSILSRGVANSRYLPVIFGAETKGQFLTNHLNFNYGDFYDTDGYFKKHVSSNDKVLLYGFHNLYYVNFSFVDSSYAKKGDMFNYIAVQDSKLPERFKFWKLIYSNPKTQVKLYSFGGQKWVY